MMSEAQGLVDQCVGRRGWIVDEEQLRRFGEAGRSGDVVPAGVERSASHAQRRRARSSAPIPLLDSTRS